jgi:hypothetical protein
MPPENASSTLAQLDARVTELERRVHSLEHPFAFSSSGLPVSASPIGTQASASRSQTSAIAVFGKVILGIAGAYVLRAAAESRVFPMAIIMAVALLYVATWMIWAARSGIESRLARHSYAITAALILSPMLWEVTVRFRIIEPRVTAVMLVGFAVLLTALAWRRDLSHVVWPGMFSIVTIALILIPATREPVPFVIALLAMALVTEFAASRGRWPGLRLLVAGATDFASFLLILILGNSKAVPPEYRPAAPTIMIALVITLFAIYAVAPVVWSFVRRLRITLVDAVQLAVAALLAGWGVLRITQGSGATALGIFCLLAGGGSYFTAFAPLSKRLGRLNFQFYATWGLAFVLAGSFCALPRTPLVLGLCLAAVVTTALGVIGHNPTLDLHAVVYLVAAVSASHLLEYAGRALAGSYLPAPGGLVLFTAAVTLLSTAIISRYPGQGWNERLLRLLPAVIGVYSVAGLAVTAIVRVILRGSTPPHPVLAVIRTVVTCSAALLLVFVGSRWNRREFVWMAYGAIVLGGLKLVVEDVRLGSTQSLALSLLVYGAVLILIPHFARAFLSSSRTAG